MNIAIIDADIIGRKKHTFPNLACMKISSYHKKCGDTVTLLLSYDDIAFFDKVYISKVFTDTFVDDKYLRCSNVVFGGTGFFYDKAVPLPFDIEHIMPDYTLYDSWVDDCIKSGAKPADFSYYKEYSIGFLTRGCFRKCAFCVNKNYDKCLSHSNVLEFYDKTRPKLCFLDDNFFACANWFDIIQDVKKLGVPFQFKQGLDERLLTDKHIHEIMSWKYDGDFIFAFDNVEDSVLIESKLKRIFELYPNFKKRLKFYLFCGFDKYGIYDDDFWVRDIVSLFYRAFILAKYSALPYVMRFEKVYSSSYSGLYSVIASWCNQPSFFKKVLQLKTVAP